MRKKIKEIMNKEEGFTLVELLAILAILAIIVAIAIPAIGNVIGNSQEKATAAETELVEDAARLYYIEFEDEFGDTEKLVGVKELIATGYLEERGNENLVGAVKVNETGNKVTYEYDKEATDPGVVSRPE